MSETDELLKQILEEIKLLREDFNLAFFEDDEEGEDEEGSEESSE